MDQVSNIHTLIIFGVVTLCSGLSLIAVFVFSYFSDKKNFQNKKQNGIISGAYDDALVHPIVAACLQTHYEPKTDDHWYRCDDCLWFFDKPIKRRLDYGIGKMRPNLTCPKCWSTNYEEVGA